MITRGSGFIYEQCKDGLSPDFFLVTSFSEVTAFAVAGKAPLLPGDVIEIDLHLSRSFPDTIKTIRIPLFRNDTAQWVQHPDLAAADVLMIPISHLFVLYLPKVFSFDEDIIAPTLLQPRPYHLMVCGYPENGTNQKRSHVQKRCDILHSLTTPDSDETMLLTDVPASAGLCGAPVVMVTPAPDEHALPEIRLLGILGQLPQALRRETSLPGGSADRSVIWSASILARAVCPVSTSDTPARIMDRSA